MKEPVNGVQSMNGSAVPMGLINTSKIRRAWALYISKWLKAYKKKGLPVWAVTPQNEPEFPAPWEACAWDASGERDWITEDLGPVLRQNHPSMKLLAFDHNKDHLKVWADSILGSRHASQYVDGLAFHWYTGTSDRLLDGTYGYDTVNATHHAYPKKILLVSLFFFKSKSEGYISLY